MAGFEVEAVLRNSRPSVSSGQLYLLRLIAAERLVGIQRIFGQVHAAFRIPRTIRLIGFSFVTWCPHRLIFKSGGFHLLGNHRGGQMTKRLYELTALHQVDGTFAESRI